LHVGAATQAVTVTQGVNLVEPASSTVETLVTAETIDRVPLLYRNCLRSRLLERGCDSG
jgi:hypothetical protein